MVEKRKRQKTNGIPLQRQNPKVDEAKRIRIHEVLQRFRASKDEGKALVKCSIWALLICLTKKMIWHSLSEKKKWLF